MPESPDSRPRLGDLLLSADLITQKQLDDSLTLARTAGKPLGHVLVEQGLVPARSIAMALADQHGGPLKTEFGFATGRGTTPRPANLPRQAPSAPPVLRLASSSVPARAVEPAARPSAEARANELLAHVDELQAELVAERATSERAARAADTLSAQLEELRSRQAADADALSDAEGALAEVRGELDRITELEGAARAAQASVVEPLHGEVAELRAVIELQEQALAAAAARELERDDRPSVDNSGTRSYSHDAHFLFAPGADGYELLERSGPSPAPGAVVELSGRRTCRVLRVGPAPFPGALEACAYLELV